MDVLTVHFSNEFLRKCKATPQNITRLFNSAFLFMCSWNGAGSIEQHITTRKLHYDRIIDQVKG